jgi:hypothetical protein
MKIISKCLALLVAIIAVASATPASAQATRTWVSGVGDDVNPCSRTAPCKTFAGAISKTAAGGEINCLDPAGFGAVTLTKSITIDCTGTLGGILSSSTTGVIVNGAGAIVVLRGLEINGGPPNLPGVNGVRYLQGASLTIEDCTIYNNLAAAPNGHGIIVNNTSGAARLVVVNTVINNNGAVGSGGGIGILATGTATVVATLQGVHLVNNPNAGLRIDTSGNTGTGIIVSVSNSTISGSTSGIVANQPAGTAPINVIVTGSTIANNGSFGILASGATTRVRVGSSLIMNNGTAAFSAAGAIVNSYGNNQINNNATSDGTFVGNPLS